MLGWSYKMKMIYLILEFHIEFNFQINPKESPLQLVEVRKHLLQLYLYLRYKNSNPLRSICLMKLMLTLMHQMPKDFLPSWKKDLKKVNLSWYL